MFTADSTPGFGDRRGQRARWGRIRPLLRLQLTVASALLVAACGSDDSAGEPSAARRGDAAPPPSGGQESPVVPSFDCTAASGEVEELICSDAGLATLDLRLDSVWGEVEAQLASGSWPESEQQRVRAEQRGWISGRNDCWKDEEPSRCAAQAYERRIVTLQAQFALVEGREPTFWSCEGNPANEFVLTVFDTDPGSVRVERGDGQEVMLQTPTASGARYLGDFGKEVWVQGEEGTFVWPQEDTLRCVLASPR